MKSKRGKQLTASLLQRPWIKVGVAGIITTCLVFFGFYVLQKERVVPSSAETKENGSTFLYYGYGSNLLKERIHIQNPTARFKAIGSLQDHRLAFNMFSARWQGHVATIVDDPGEEVWGVIWELDLKDLSNLDDQEGVHEGWYRRIDVEVVSDKGETYHCQTYELTQPWDDDPRPSPQYKAVIVNGAIQNKLPPEYIDKLKDISDNGYSGTLDVNLATHLLRYEL